MWLLITGCSRCRSVVHCLRKQSFRQPWTALLLGGWVCSVAPAVFLPQYVSEEMSKLHVQGELRRWLQHTLVFAWSTAWVATGAVFAIWSGCSLPSTVSLKTPVAFTGVAPAGWFRDHQPFAVHSLELLWWEQISSQEVSCSHPEAFGTEPENMRTPWKVAAVWVKHWGRCVDLWMTLKMVFVRASKFSSWAQEQCVAVYWLMSLTQIMQ